MLTEREIVAAMQDGNPVPEPAHLADDPIGFDILLDKISERRVPMLSTPQTRTEETKHAIPSPPRWSRKPLAVAASFVLVLMLIGVGALIFRGGDSDVATSTTPASVPSSSVPSSTTLPPAIATPETIPTTPTTPAAVPQMPAGEFVTFGPSEGVPEGCGYLMAFGGDGAYLLGECGLLGFDVTSFEFLTAVPLGSLEDLEVGPDGSAWIGQVDVNVQQWTGRELIEHGLESPDLAITEDGTVLAWSLHDRQVVRYDGSEWVDEVEPGENARFEVGPDGTLWARVDGWVAIDDMNLNVGSLMSYDGESWTTHETPELVFFNIAGFTSEGAIMLAGHVFAAPRLEQRIYLVADGDGWTRYDINPPTLEELGIQPIVTELTRWTGSRSLKRRWQRMAHCGSVPAGTASSRSPAKSGPDTRPKMAWRATGSPSSRSGRTAHSGSEAKTPGSHATCRSSSSDPALRPPTRGSRRARGERAQYRLLETTATVYQQRTLT